MGVSGQRHAPAALSPGERTPGIHWIGCWVGPRAGLDAEDRGKSLSPLPGIEPPSPGRSARSQTLYWLSFRLTMYIYIYIYIREQSHLNPSNPKFHYRAHRDLLLDRILSQMNTCEISSSHGGEYDGGSTHLWNVGRQLFYTAVHPRRQFWTRWIPVHAVAP
jgi:hypothetical protein